MNQWVAPHRLVSVSAFEEDHPNTATKLFNIVILQKGRGDRQNQINKQSNEEITEIYHWDPIIEENGWENLLAKASQAAEVRERAVFTTFNWSSDSTADVQQDRQAAFVITWEKTFEDMLLDNERGGCCNIF